MNFVLRVCLALVFFWLLWFSSRLLKDFWTGHITLSLCNENIMVWLRVRGSLVLVPSCFSGLRYFLLWFIVVQATRLGNTVFQL